MYRNKSSSRSGWEWLDERTKENKKERKNKKNKKEEGKKEERKEGKKEVSFILHEYHA